MKVTTRIILDAGGRSANFSSAHPDTDPAAIAVADRLTLLLARGEVLTQQQVAAENTLSAAVNTKTEIRLALEEVLSAIFNVSEVGARTFPDLAIHRRRPRTHASEVSLLTSARVTLAEAQANKDRLIPFGLTTEMLDTLTSSIPAYGDAVLRQRSARAAQVGAVSDLKSICREVMACIKSLDAMNRIRFKKDRELLAAWKSARNVAWPNVERAAPVTPPAPPAREASAA